MSDEETSSSTHLQLGDIIRLQTPSDPKTHDKVFLINYLDSKQLILSNVTDGEEITLPIDNGKFDDSVAPVTQIEILDRPQDLGFARQNNLLPGTWVDIHFGGDVPAIFTGNISDLEEDMIEVRTVPGDERIYIDFGYKGIPRDLPLEKIIIREAPVGAEKKALPEQVDIELPIDESEDVDVLEPEVGEETTTVKEVKSQLREMLLDANEIKIGMELEAVTQIVELPEEQQRFGLEKQTNDMLDEMLSNIPNADRTREVLNNIHRMIERFKQLRSAYSVFDEQGNASMPKAFDAGHKPLVQTLTKLNHSLYWLLPIVKSRKKLYDVDSDASDMISDIVPLSMAETRLSEEAIVMRYRNNDVPEGENKLSYLQNALQPFLTPFTESLGDSDCMLAKRVENNISAIVDTLGDFYSSVSNNDNVRRKRFLVQRYNLGLRKLQTTELKGNKSITKSVPLTPNDDICVSGFLTLPESVVNFSHINLPSTNMMTRSNLAKHFVQYWELLRRSTEITTNVVSDPADLSFDSDNFLSGYMSFALEKEGSVSSEEYEQFLQAMIPRTRVLFNSVKRYITGSLSLHKLVEYLEPFMIYSQDLTFKQYEEMMGFVLEKINEYKRQYVEYIRSLAILAHNKSSRNEIAAGIGRPSILSDEALHLSGIGPKHQQLLRQIESSYKLPLFLAGETWSSSQILSEMLGLDNMRLYSITVSAINKFSIVPTWAGSRIQQVQDEYIESVQNEEPTVKDTRCSQYTLAKKYRNLDDLLADNDETIYFDPVYDPTRYSILEEYGQQQEAMDKDAFIGYLEEQLVQNVGLTADSAAREAKAMLEGKREIESGDYAVLRVAKNPEDPADLEDLFYKRENDKWELDESIDKDVFTDESKMLCNLQSDCFQVKESCLSNDKAGQDIDKNRIQAMVDEFAGQLEWDAKITQEAIAERVVYLENIMGPLIRIRQNEKLKYNKQQLALAGDIDEQDIISSPYEKLRDIILGQGDFVKRQHDIVRFCERFTRVPTESEDQFWLYDAEVDVKLLPMFLHTLAQAFVASSDGPDSYYHALSRVCAEQGSISDDGDAWVDKHSGYVIRSIEFDNEEGYTEAGYKQISRDILEADLGNAVLQSTDAKNDDDDLSPQGKAIATITNTMAGFMGITIENQKEFIIRNAQITQKKALPSEEAYKKAVEAAIKRGKKRPPTYEDAYDESLLLVILSYLVVAIQTSIPSVATKKTHPGCKRSFQGYPLGSEGDLGGITYVACIANKIKSSVGLWRTIQKKNEQTLIKAIKTIIDKFIFTDPMIQEKLQEKRNYMMLETANEVPAELDVRLWNGFMPPLVPINLPTPLPVSDAFSQSLKSNIKLGKKESNAQIGVLQSKITYFSLAIIEAIQSIIDKKAALLTNASGEPFLENTCCSEGIVHPTPYFVQAEPTIAQFNKFARKARDTLFDIGSLGQAPFLYDPADTKRRYPSISSDFSEETIFKAFIYYCHFDTDIPVSEKLRAVCVAKPENYSIDDDIAEKIRKLRTEGHMYGIESLEQLMQVINSENIVPVNLSETVSNNINSFGDIVTALDGNAGEIIGQPLLTKLSTLVSEFNTTLSESSPAMRDAKNYLAASNSQMSAELVSFMRQYSKLSRAKLSQFKEQIEGFSSGFSGSQPESIIKSSEQSVYKSMIFVKQTLDNLLRVFPQMILHEMDYSETKVPKHWKLSQRHTSDVQEFIKKHYAPLRSFYKDKAVTKIVSSVSDEGKNLLLLSDYTPFYAATENHISTFDGKLVGLLFQHYFLLALVNYTSSIENKQLEVKEIPVAMEGDWAGTEDGVAAAVTGQVTEVQIVRGEKKAIGQKVANLLLAMLEIEEKNKSYSSMSYREVMEKVHRAKEKEKDNITDFLKGLTDEEREIENLFKNNKLERWSKGLQKGLTQYVQKTYDQERDEMEKQALMEKRLGKKSVVTDMNRDIYALDLIAEEETSAAIEAEELDMSHLPDDDDDGGDDTAYMYDDYDE